MARGSALAVPDGTPVQLRLNRTLSSPDARVGQHVQFEVLAEVRVGDFVVIPRGSAAFGFLTKVSSQATMGHSGKLNVDVDYAQTRSGTYIALRGTEVAQNVGLIAGMVSKTIAFLPPVSPFPFLHRKNAVTQIDAAFTAYTNGETMIDSPSFKRRQKGNPDIDQPNGSEFSRTPITNREERNDSARSGISRQANPDIARPNISESSRTLILNPEIRSDSSPSSIPKSGNPDTGQPKSLTQARKVLTNSDVMQLQNAGLGDDVILEKLNASTVSLQLDTDDLIQLKKSGVSDKVIGAMVRAGSKF